MNTDLGWSTYIFRPWTAGDRAQASDFAFEENELIPDARLRAIPKDKTK